MTENDECGGTPKRKCFNWLSFYTCTTPAAALNHKIRLPHSTAYGGPSETKSELFCLSDLWMSFEDASIFGIEVPTVDKFGASSYATYIPYLSGIRVIANSNFISANVTNFGSTSNSSSGGDCCASPFSSVGFKGNSSGEQRKGPGIVVEYFETRPPHMRQPLFFQLRALSEGHLIALDPIHIDLLCTHTSNLQDKSWLAIYWRPVNQMVGKWTDDASDAPCESFPSFLVFYSLKQLAEEPNESRLVARLPEDLPILRLQSFGVVPHGGNLSLWAADENSDGTLENSLRFFSLQNRRLESWLACEKVKLPDFDFFVSRLHHTAARVGAF